MTFPSIQFSTVGKAPGPASLKINTLRFGNETAETPEWKAEETQLGEWLQQRHNPDNSPFSQFYNQLQTVFSEEFGSNDQPLHPDAAISRPAPVSDEPPIPGNILDSRTSDGYDFLETLQELLSMTPDKAEQRLNRLISSSKAAAPFAMRVAYESKGAHSANMLALYYFRAAVKESHGVWDIENPEALTKAFQWEAVARRNGQESFSIFETKGSNPEDERKAIWDKLGAEEQAHIREAQRDWLKKFPQTA